MRKLRKNLDLGPGYQSKTVDNEQRWNLTREYLDDRDRSVMDIGSNLGFFTARAAALGKVAIGVEPSPRFVRRARRRLAGVQGFGFMQLEVSPETVVSLPEVDVTFRMSVFHLWVRFFGEDAAWAMVGALLSKAKRKFFFEPASRQSKFGNRDLDFVDLDEMSIRAYVERNMRGLLRDEEEVLCLGSTPGVGKEEFRTLFVVK
jgi:SAM-dependent methyltransferase